MEALTPPEFLQIDCGNVSHELIDGEVVVIHFPTGNYFSLTGTAAEIWRQLEQPTRTDSLCSLFAEGSDDAKIQEFVSALHNEGLLIAMETGEPATSGAGPFSPPVLNKYTDMQQLLLADPLHEVEDTGWPNTTTPV